MKMELEEAMKINRTYRFLVSYKSLFILVRGLYNRFSFVSKKEIETGWVYQVKGSEKTNPSWVIEGLYRLANK